MSIEQGAIFWHDFGPRQNHLQEGKRPALVVQTDGLNRLEGYPNTMIVPLTTKGRQSPTYVQIEPTPESGLERTSWAITNQVFTIGKGDLGERIGQVSRKELFGIKEGLKIAFSIA